MKVLVDANVWIDHLRSNLPALTELIRDNLVLAHTYVIFELASGNLGKNRSQILSDLGFLDRVSHSTEQEFFEFVKTAKLMGQGLSFVDIELLWAALSNGCKLWTRDKKLGFFCKKYGCEFVHA